MEDRIEDTVDVQVEQTSAQQKEEKQLATTTSAEVVVSDEGYLQAKTLEGRYRIAKALLASGALPQHYKNASQVLVAMEQATHLGVSAVLGINKMCLINGSPAIWGELPLALAYSKKYISDHEEIFFDKDYNEICFKNKNLNVDVFGCVSRVTRKDTGRVVERTFTIDDAKAAGLLGKDVYKKYLKRMLQMRARSWALKDAAAELFFGIPIAEYDYNTIIDSNEPRDLNHDGSIKVDPAKMLNSMLEGATKA
jgi:hypothetical protein